RHTRWPRDWSSDVCSSDLRILRPINPIVLKNLSDDLRALANLLGRAHDLSFLGDRLRDGDQKSEWEREGHKLLAVIEVSQEDLRSEERRVGKEGRAGGWAS